MVGPLLSAAAGAWLISRHHSAGETIHIQENDAPLIPSPEEMREILDLVQHMEVREPLRIRNVTHSQQYQDKCVRNSLVKTD